MSGFVPRSFMAPRPQQPVWALTVVDAFDVSPRMRRVRLVGEDMRAFDYWPGQDLVLNIPTADGPARRHYTIRSYDPVEQRLDIDFVLHGDSPAVRWAKTAAIGSALAVNGPRGRTSVRGQAALRLFIGDETALPGIFHMAESLAPEEKARIFLEISGEEDIQTLDARADVEITWHVRGHGAQSVLPEVLAGYDLPKGAIQAAVIGQTAMVRAVRQGLIARCVPKDNIVAEGYWRPGRVGGHDHVFDEGEGRGGLGRPQRGERRRERG
ncbi:MAG: siderophore-interacting protein [Caulobacteraceae bacterium]